MRSEAWLRLMSGLVLIGVFAAGALFGAGLMRWNAPSRPPLPPPPSGPIHAIEVELALDADQRAALEAIANAHRAELDGIGRETQHRVRRVLFAIEDELVPKLRADQVDKLAAWRRTRRPPPPPPGMGPPGGPGMGRPGGPEMGPPGPGMEPPPGAPEMRSPHSELPGDAP